MLQTASRLALKDNEIIVSQPKAAMLEDEYNRY